MFNQSLQILDHKGHFGHFKFRLPAIQTCKFVVQTLYTN